MQVNSWTATPGTSSLKLHLDAGNLGLPDNTAIATWNDISGNGNNATGIPGGTGTALPTYSSSIAGLNNKPSVLFDLTNGRFSAPGAAIPASLSSFSTYAAARKLTATANVIYSFADGTDCNTANLQFYHSGLGNAVMDRCVVGASAVGTTETTATNSSYIAGGYFTTGTNIQGVSLNGNTPATNAGVGWNTTTLYIGSRPTTDLPVGYLSELLIFHSNNLNASINTLYGGTWKDSDIVECYLSAKYGIAIAHSCP